MESLFKFRSRAITNSTTSNESVPNSFSKSHSGLTLIESISNCLPTMISKYCFYNHYSLIIETISFKKIYE